MKLKINAYHHNALIQIKFPNNNQNFMKLKLITYQYNTAMYIKFHNNIISST